MPRGQRERRILDAVVEVQNTQQLPNIRDSPVARHRAVAQATDAAGQCACCRQALFEAGKRVEVGTVRVLHPDESREIVRHRAVEVVGESWHGPRHARLDGPVLALSRGRSTVDGVGRSSGRVVAQLLASRRDRRPSRTPSGALHRAVGKLEPS